MCIRDRAEAADVYIINRENVVWLVENHRWDFSTVVIDELSSFKSVSYTHLGQQENGR